MCTALSLTTKDRYFGRNLDIDRSYGEEICVMPRRFPLEFRKTGKISEHHAMLGMAAIVSGAPLFYEAVNEYGLAMAGLNFPDNAYYSPVAERNDNIAPFELIWWILGQCKTVNEVKTLLSRINIVDIPFSEQLPLSPLHWLISDKNGDIVVEAMKDGLHIRANPAGVLTNNPPFEAQLENLKKYRHLSNDNTEVERDEERSYSSYCQGLGALGLPGDVSSMSRFVRAAFGRAGSVCDTDEPSSVGQFFHLLSSVEMVRGICKNDEGAWDITLYSACINTDKGLYYYTTYDNRQITCVDMHKTDLDGTQIYRFPLVSGQKIKYRN